MAQGLLGACGVLGARSGRRAAVSWAKQASAAALAGGCTTLPACCRCPVVVEVLQGVLETPLPPPCRRGPIAVEVAQSVLDTPAMASLELFLLRARARQKFLEIRLDQVPLRWG